MSKLLTTLFQTGAKAASKAGAKNLSTITVSAEHLMIFAQARIVHQGLIATIMAAQEIASQNVVVVYPKDFESNSASPFSYEQRLAMLLKSLEAQKLHKPTALVVISNNLWQNLQNKKTSQVALEAITTSLGMKPKDFLYIRGQAQQSRDHGIYPQIEELKLPIYAAPVMSLLPNKEVISSDFIFKHFNSEDMILRQDARAAVSQEALKIIAWLSREDAKRNISELPNLSELQPLAIEETPDFSSIAKASKKEPEKANDKPTIKIIPANCVLSPKSIGLFLGRLQAFHKGHQAIVDTMLRSNDLCAIIVASSTQSSAKTPHSFEQIKSFIEAVYLKEIKSGRLVILDRDTHLGNSHDPQSWQKLVETLNLDTKKGVATIYAGKKAADIVNGEGHYIEKVARAAGFSLNLVAPIKYSAIGTVKEDSKSLEQIDASAYYITTNPTSQMAMQLVDPKIIALIYRYWACTHIMNSDPAASKIINIMDVTKADLDAHKTQIDNFIRDLNNKELALRPDSEGQEVVVFNKKTLGIVPQSEIPEVEKLPKASVRDGAASAIASNAKGLSA